MVSPAAQRVRNATAPHVNDKIRQNADRSIAFYAANPDQITQRLEELDAEWDVERCLETGASSLTIFGVLRALTGRRSGLLLAMIVPGFLLQHAIQGWCPPLEVFRRLGFRTRGEIDEERYALKALRGDFRELSEPDTGSTAPEQRARKAGRAARAG